MIYIDKKKVRCPRCGARTIPCKSINEQESTFWVKCSRPQCKTYIDTYIPMDFQQDIHADSTRYVMVAGGYGSSKTTVLFKDDEKHILLVGKGRTLMGADTLPQLENTAKKDFETDFPADFVKKYSVQKNQVTFNNGHELMYRPMNDEGNLRSLNLTRFHLVEASEIDFENFTQLQTRLRNTNGVIYETDDEDNIIYTEDDEGKPIPLVKCDVRQGTLESNPDSGWIREQFLLNSGTVISYGGLPYYDILDPDANRASYIIPTEANYHLPPGFKKEISKGKPGWWIRRYLEGSFEYAEGLVYPNIISCEKAHKDINLRTGLGIKYAVGMDYGISDNTHFVFLHIDTSEKMVTAFGEIVLNNRNIHDICTEYFKVVDQIPRGQMLTPVMDGRSFSKRTDTERGVIRTIGQMFLNEGAYFKPAQMDLNSRILHLNRFIEDGRFQIDKDMCPALCKEINDYKFPDKSLEKQGGANMDKPVDRRNHGVNALEFIMMDIPFELDFENYIIYNNGEAVMDRRYKDDQVAKARGMYNPYADISPSRKKLTAQLRDLGDEDLW